MLKVKQKNKKRKLLHSIDLIMEYGFIDANYGISIKENGVKWIGTAYEMELPKDVIKETYEKFDNVKFIETYCEYAPEIHKTWMFVSYNYKIEG